MQDYILEKPQNRIEELELELMKKEIEIARLKKRLYGERSWSWKEVRYYIRQEYKMVDEYKEKYSITLLCNYMSISRSGYYKWKYREKYPSLKEITRKSDLEFIKKVYKKT